MAHLQFILFFNDLILRFVCVYYLIFDLVFLNLILENDIFIASLGVLFVAVTFIVFKLFALGKLYSTSGKFLDDSLSLFL